MSYTNKYYRRKKRVLEGGELRRLLYSVEKVFFWAFFLVFIGSCILALQIRSSQLLFLGLSGVSGFLAVLFFFRYWWHGQYLKKWNTVEEVQQNLDPWEFEKWVGILLKKLGYKRVKVVGGCNKGDGGIDVVCYSQDGLYTVVQCKKYIRWVTVDEVRDFLGAMTDFKAQKGIFVTTSQFTQSCRDLEQRHDLELWDKGKLSSLI